MCLDLLYYHFIFEIKYVKIIILFQSINVCNKELKSMRRQKYTLMSIRFLMGLSLLFINILNQSNGSWLDSNGSLAVLITLRAIMLICDVYMISLFYFLLFSFIKQALDSPYHGKGVLSKFTTFMISWVIMLTLMFSSTLIIYELAYIVQDV